MPPLIEAQRLVTLAAMAYMRRDFSDGLNHAVAATQLGDLGVAVPGAARSEAAFRMYRNVGLALLGRETERTVDELRSAFEQFTFIPQIFAAWGRAVVAERSGDAATARAMRDFIAAHAPHVRLP